MKNRIITVIVGMLILCGVIFGFTGCGQNEYTSNEYTSEEMIGYVFFPNGKMMAYGEVDYIWIRSNGEYVIAIDGHEYTTHISNVLIDTVEK